MRTLTFTLTLIITAFFAGTVPAEEVTFDQAASAFAELLNSSNSKVSISEASGVSVAEATSVSIGGTVYETAVKVWFRLSKDGRFVNPSLHRWDPRERFRVFVQSSVPVYFALYQTYPEDRPATKQVYPDKRYAQTFYAVPAGKIFEIPVEFEMDNDLRKEIIQLTFARVDEPALGGTVVVSATATATASAAASAAGGNTAAAAAVAETLTTRTDGAVGAAAAGAASASRGVLMSAKSAGTAMDYLSKLAVAGGTAVTATASASVSVASTMVSSITNDDVAVYVFGVGKTAQTQLTLNK